MYVILINRLCNNCLSFCFSSEWCTTVCIPSDLTNDTNVTCISFILSQFLYQLCGVLHWFHTINERSDLNLARLEDFHCSGIEMMPMEALYEDLVTYQCANDGQRSSNFFLVAHPFLLSISVKQDLLNVESQMSMVEAAQAGGVSFDPESREYKFKPYFVLAIDRKYLLPQTLQAVAKASTIELRKSLRIVFKGEDG